MVGRLVEGVGLDLVVVVQGRGGGEQRQAERQEKRRPDPFAVHGVPDARQTVIGALQKKGADGQKNDEGEHRQGDPHADAQTGHRGSVDQRLAHHAALLRHIDLVKDPFVTEVIRLHFCPTAEGIDAHKIQLWEACDICWIGGGGIPCAVEMLEREGLRLG